MWTSATERMRASSTMKRMTASNHKIRLPGLGGGVLMYRVYA